ncbi:MAG: LPS export ABC transporter periplasmic protein LptC [Treponema sp.]|nr:LPS export ABC transporter periplasmic protein LptC [Treponema sp.]
MKKSVFVFALLFSCSMIFAEKIIFSAASMSGQTGGSGTTKLSGDAFIKTESMEIMADSIELSGDDYKKIIAKGNIAGKNTDSGMEFKCDSMTYDRDTKIALLEGNVSLIDSENDVKASAQLIEYNQDTEMAVLQIEVKLTQKKNICTSAYAVYEKQKQFLELSGNAQVKQEQDTFRAQIISLNLDTQDITLSGNVKGSVTDTNKKEEKNPETDVQKAPAAAEKTVEPEAEAENKD